MVKILSRSNTCGKTKHLNNVYSPLKTEYYVHFEGLL